MPKAERASVELRSTNVKEIELIEGSNGIFDVEIDGKLVFSKYKTARFPNDGELAELVH
ncbi:MAG: Rdx family protein [SAR324 cluster bacterium]|nr:hypothetical protein [Deltaproteobacteria bacterium]MAD99613.1 hypothetical protein [Pseudomonadota bacterium]MDP6091698.1 Rdx family protein [SAR324 cluster bacterium]MBI12947.1 hypothetical protein [Deltaproteobacteria bacterium]MBP44664.1 hypothetical protein [Deltaproteobacteria bacterium]